jgi:predicted PurR-regulated permease PerM
MKKLQSKGIPRSISLTFVTIFLLLVLTLFVIFIGGEINKFIGNIATYRVQIDNFLKELSLISIKHGINLKIDELKNLIHLQKVVSFFKNMLLQFGSQFSNTILILFTTAFMIMDSIYIDAKLKKILNFEERKVNRLSNLFRKIDRYFLIMTKISLITAILVYTVLWIYDVDYALLWATLSFLLNFIPVIGSIIATIPPIILSLIQQEWSVSIWLGVWYLSINMLVGNILQPAMLGRGLGLSAFAVFWSMVFWGWVFGPAGMIMSVPLTMAMQFWLMQYPQTYWIGFMLSDYKGKEIGKD